MTNAINTINAYIANIDNEEFEMNIKVCLAGTNEFFFVVVDEDLDLNEVFGNLVRDINDELVLVVRDESDFNDIRKAA